MSDTPEPRWLGLVFKRQSIKPDDINRKINNHLPFCAQRKRDRDRERERALREPRVYELEAFYARIVHG